MPAYEIGIYRRYQSLLTLDALSGQPDVTIADASSFIIGDIVRIEDSNNEEYQEIQNIVGNILTMTLNLTNSYLVADNAKVVLCKDITLTALIEQEEVLSIQASVGVSGRVFESTVIVDNDPKKDIRSGDAIIIKLGWVGGTLRTVFSGEIYSTNRRRVDEEESLEIRVRDWSFLFLTDKITYSEPISVNAETILRNLLNGIYGGTDFLSTVPSDLDPTICDHMIRDDEIGNPPYAVASTRTIDFVGEPILDCVNKISSITQRDWYIGPKLDWSKDKVFHWFDRNSRSSGKTLMREEISELGLKDPYETLCNKVEFYGKDNKPIPWDCDEYSESGTPVVGNQIVDPYGTWEPVQPARSSISWELTEVREGERAIRIDCDNALAGTELWDPLPCFCSTNDSGVYFFVHSMFIACPPGQQITLVNAKVSNCTTQVGGQYKITYQFGVNPPVTLVNNQPMHQNIGCGGIPCGSNCCPACVEDTHVSGAIGGTNESLSVAWYMRYTGLSDGQCYCMRDYKFSYSVGINQYLGAKLSLNSSYQIDLTKKESPRKFIVSLFPHLVNSPPAGSYSSAYIELGFTDGSNAIYFQEYHYFEVDRWTTAEIEVGPNASGWTGSNPSCEGIVSSIKICVNNPAAAHLDDYLLIDFLHFDEAKWYGEYEDIASQGTYGIKFKEIFDDTLYSDTAAQRRSREYVEKFKEPIQTVENVIVEYNGQETLRPGETIVLSDLIPEFAGLSLPDRTYRIDEIHHKFTEDYDYEVQLILSIDPIQFTGSIQGISERVRRLEEKFRRRPAVEPTEV